MYNFATLMTVYHKQKHLVLAEHMWIAGGKAFPSMVSVDCEMCITAAGYELTRASLVDDKGQASLGCNLSKLA